MLPARSTDRAVCEAAAALTMGAGTDVAMQTAGITRIQGGRRAILKAMRIGRATMIAGVAMSLSSVSVISNALRLRRGGF